ncbi:lasso peptide biosynthesis B2 protein [Cognatishimia sp. F0-27]|uniref:lasso peptide biosynthesis B2 protein n=1 Tax=Cognatishimia sp. F0-27 TaxID=2816855 RepID=UPI001D0CCDB2|nr:lasso peptide biosynthesis B2 protein [Cognatishimia sp. F0-27]MCC1493811.1 lasso peptide biosynthesis B2 protein [Cognatishimia sp. F0-27]
MVDLARAVLFLAVARVRVARAPLADFAVTTQGRTEPLSAFEAALVHRVAWAIPRAANRVPWQSKCLVQAVAARTWLSRSGIDAELVLGMPRERTGPFEAHAWLRRDGIVITGGDVSGYVPFEAKRS